jgi:hypothetical protein
MTTAVMRDFVFTGMELESSKLPVTPEQKKEGAKTWFALSPFHRPRGMQFSASSNHEAVIRFSYENDEPPEANFRKVGKDLAVLLAEHSKKVLSIKIEGDVRRHLEQGTLFSSKYTKQLEDEVPPSSCYSLVHNAELIASLLKGLPQDFFKPVLERLRLGK